MNPYMYQEQDDEDLHSNMAGMYEGMDENDDMAPYDSISDREPLPEEDSSQAAIPAISATPMQRSSLFDQVSQAVTKRVNPTPPWAQGLSEKLQASMPSQPPPEEPAPPPPPPKNDYGASQYEKGFDDLNRFRRATVNSDFISNFGNAVSQAAQGVNPTPVNQDLYNNMQRQGHDLLVSKTHDLDRRSRIINALENRKMRESIAEKQLQAKLAGTDKKKLDMQSRIDAQNIAKVNSLYKDPGINRETTKLNAARSAQALIEAIEKGEITGSKNIANQFTNIISTIEMGGPGAAADREKMGVDSLYGGINNFLNYLSGSPGNVLTSDQFKQLKKEAYGLGDRAAKNWKSLTDAAIAGSDLSKVNPDGNSGHINKLAKQRQDTYLLKNGFDPETAEPVNRSQNYGSKTIIQKRYSPSRNQTHIIYSDGKQDFVDGKR